MVEDENARKRRRERSFMSIIDLGLGIALMAHQVLSERHNGVVFR